MPVAKRNERPIPQFGEPDQDSQLLPTLLVISMVASFGLAYFIRSLL